MLLVPAAANGSVPVPCPHREPLAPVRKAPAPQCEQPPWIQGPLGMGAMFGSSRQRDAPIPAGTFWDAQK